MNVTIAALDTADLGLLLSGRWGAPRDDARSRKLHRAGLAEASPAGRLALWETTTAGWRSVLKAATPGTPAHWTATMELRRRG